MYLFQGRPVDPVIGDYDNRGRVFSPSLGRPIQVDPLRLRAGDGNLYRWEGNGPVIRLDPTGLKGAPSVPVDNGCNDTCGPDVTLWFLKDLRKYVSRLRGAREIMNDIEYAKTWRLAVKYWLCYKWMSFTCEGCGTGKCANTVMFAGVCLRKNQLGNIAFGFLVNTTGLLSEKYDITTAYSVIGANGTYDRDHPYSGNYGQYAGASRADNLAAFSLGAEMAGSPWAGLSGDQWASLVTGTIAANGDRPGLYSRYGDLYGKGTQLDIDNLTFIPEYGGFNTRSCKTCMGKGGKPSIYDGPGSMETFGSSGPGFLLSKGVPEAEVDKQLRETFENYWNPAVPRK
jgi:RHS repeat-associated protein